MKDRIEALAAGNVAEQKPALAFLPEAFDERVSAGGTRPFEMQVVSENRVSFKGFFFSTDPRVKACTRQAAGLRATIALEVSTPAGVREEIAGELVCVSNAGTYRIPFSFQAEPAGTSLAIPQSLEELAALALEKPQEAAVLFADDAITDSPVFAGSERRALRSGLLTDGHAGQALEAFLVAEGAKEAVRLSFAEDSVQVSGNALLTEQGALVKASAPGYFRARVESDSPWLIPLQNRFGAEDLKDGLRYRIDTARLHAGRNFGRLTIRQGGEESRLAVTVTNPAGAHRRGADKSRSLWLPLLRSLTELLMQSPQDPLTLFADDGIGKKSEALAGAKELIEAGAKQYPANILLQLLHAWLLLDNGQKKEAKRILEWCAPAIGKTRENLSGEFCLLQYLAARLMEDQAVKEQAKREIHRSFEEHPTLLSGLLELYAVEERTLGDELGFLRMLSAQEGNSPILLALAANAVKGRSAVLREADLFTLQVMRFLQKRRELPAAVTERFLSLAAEEAPVCGLLGRVAQDIYHTTADRRALALVCRVLVRRGDTGEKALHWLADGVKREVPVNGLSDAYLTALAADGRREELPESLFYYYSYKNTLGRRARLYLYSRLLETYPGDGELCRAYEDQMGKFAIRQLLEGRMDPALVRLYDEVLTPEFIDSHLSRVLPDLLFSRRIRTASPAAQTVIVHYPEITEEYTAPVRAGEACVPVYTDTAAILFADAFGNRFADKAAVAERLMDRPELLAICRGHVPEQPMLLLNEMQDASDAPITGARQMRLAMELLGTGLLRPAFQTLLEDRLIDCAGELPLGQTQELTGFLAGLSAAGRDVGHAAKLIRQDVLRGRLKEAERALAITGPTQLPADTLLPIAAHAMKERRGAYQEELLELCAYMADITEDRDVLHYVSRYLEADARTLYTLLLRVRAAGLPEAGLAKRALTTALFSGEEEHLDELYDSLKGEGEEEELLRRAYLCVKAHRVVLEGRNASPQLSDMLRAAVQEKNAPLVLRLAFLIDCAGREEISDEERERCERLLFDLTGAGILHPCFPALKKHLVLPHRLEGRLIAGAVGIAGLLPAVQVSHSPAGKEEELPLREIYPGVYSVSVFAFPDEAISIRFAGEDVQGKLSFKSAEGSPAEELHLSAGDAYVRDGSLYAALAEQASLAEKGRMEEWKNAYWRFMRRQMTARELFTPLAEEELREQ